jgi:hypothetical protein
LRESVDEEFEQEFESCVGIAGHDVVGERDEIREPLGWERGEVVARHRRSLLRRRLVGRRLACLAGLVDREAVDGGDEEVVAEHGERVGDAAGAEDGEDAFAVFAGIVPVSALVSAAAIGESPLTPVRLLGAIAVAAGVSLGLTGRDPVTESTV